MKITPLKMWVQNVLPVVYDDSLSYYEMVGKINEKTNEIIEQVNENTDGIEALNQIIQQLGDIDELKALLEEVETIVNDLYTDDTPAMDSANGGAGIANHAARSDHSHPSDTSKANKSLSINGASTGQYVKIKSTELGVPTEFEGGNWGDLPFVDNTELGLVINGNAPASNVVKGQYVILQNSTISGKVDGLYKAEADMTAGSTIDGSYLSNRISIGGLNDLTAATNMQTATVGTAYSGFSMYFARWWRCGNIVILNLNFKVETDIPNNSIVFTLSDIPITNMSYTGMCASASTSQYAGMLEIGAPDDVFRATSVGTLHAGNYIRASFVYICK